MAAAQCCAKMQLFFRGEGLADKDTFSKSDPYAVLYAARGGVCGHELGRTECIKDSLSPTFEKCIHVDYFFEQRQEMLVKVFDWDGKGPAGDDSLGSASFQLSQVMSSRSHCLKVPLERGFFYITGAEEGGNAKDILKISLAGCDLAKMDTFGLSDPYFKIGRLMANGTKQPLVYQSEVITNTLEPRWKPCTPIQVGQLSGADPNERTIYIEVWDEDMMSDDFIGEARCSVNELSVSKDSPLTLIRPNKPGKTYGDIYAATMEVIRVPTFPEFLKNGWQINLGVSIDFTGSNGDPRHPQSLHFMNPHQPNQYVRAIMSVGDILMEYDTDKMVPAFGFGAMMQNKQVSHFFHLNFEQNPYVSGIQGVLDVYGSALTAVRLSGPTNFAPTIRAVVTGSRQVARVYTVLLILTDGEITDVDRTIDALVDADDAPVSIIIVGVGNGCDFEAMNVLDADDKVLMHSNGRASRRDLVQFVPFREFQNAPQERLAAEVLREVPDQFVRWAQIVGAKPQ